jgi:hypothetical protein
MSMSEHVREHRSVLADGEKRLLGPIATWLPAAVTRRPDTGG